MKEGKGSITHFQIYPKGKIQSAAPKIQVRFEQDLLHGECGMLDAEVHFPGWRRISSSGYVRNELCSSGDRAVKCDCAEGRGQAGAPGTSSPAPSCV